MNDSLDELAAAARLLVEIAGPEPVHIEMSARGPKKYYDVHRALCEQDGRLHLLGWRTKGATLRHPDDMTRALCYDADTPGDWQRLQEAARALAASGYTPLLEVSPAGRGGHLWIIYTDLVCAAWARWHVLELAPQLAEIAESWPNAGPRAHKVRLPGGKYVQPGLSQWCILSDGRGSMLTTDGRSAARVLLDFQTSVALIPAYRPEPGSFVQGSGASMVYNATTQRQHGQGDLGEVDKWWRKKYNRFLWFQFTPQQLAALYNERHPLQEMLQLEPHGMAFSPSVQERTPSTAITKDGKAWVDFSARVRQRDGKHDGGDILELVARRNGETRAAKAGTMREIARDLVHEAKGALETAAVSGKLPPTWVASIMTEAGWQQYHRMHEVSGGEAKSTASSSWGVAGFHPSMETDEALTHQAEQGPAHLANAPSSVQSHAKQKQGALDALATEIGADLGEPCKRCGCTLYYQSGSYSMCHRCFPRPTRFGSLSNEQWARLLDFFPGCK